MSDDHDPGAYGERIAGVYDDMFGHLDPTAAVALLADLAGGGPALEKRWGGWDRRPFTAASGTHVSVYAR